MEQTRTATVPDHHTARVPPDGRRRVIVEHVTPEIDGGRFPIKRTVGEDVRITADMFADGHDLIAGVARYRFSPEEDPPGEWKEVRLAPIGNDSWGASFSVDRL